MKVVKSTDTLKSIEYVVFSFYGTRKQIVSLLVLRNLIYICLCDYRWAVVSTWHPAKVSHSITSISTMCIHIRHHHSIYRILCVICHLVNESISLIHIHWMEWKCHRMKVSKNTRENKQRKKNHTKQIDVDILSSLLFNCLLKLKMYNCDTKMPICKVCSAPSVYVLSIEYRFQWP